MMARPQHTTGPTWTDSSFVPQGLSAQPVGLPHPRGPRLARHCPILIVEDDADLREMMAQLLTLEGFRAEAVANGRDALDYLERGDCPDLILLDLMMPVMDGWEFRRRQRAHPDYAQVPVVVLSALDQARAADLGGPAFLKKPLDFDLLLDLVRRHCPEQH
jgi:CheY-like chemotaxis protein